MLIATQDGVLVKTTNPFPVAVYPVAGTGTATATCAAPVSVAIGLDTVIAANPTRRFVSVQHQGAANTLRVARAASTSGGTVGDLLGPAGGAGLPGDYWEDTHGYTGAIALRAVGGAVTVQIQEY